ncbi:hypothetical protein V8D89_006787 [Ganoderma adspersum]
MSSDSLPLGRVTTFIRDYLGVSLLGVSFGLILYGIILIQFYGYCRTFPSDTPFIRALIIALMWVCPLFIQNIVARTTTLRILETAHAVMTMHYSYISLVTDYGDLEALIHLPWSFNMMPLMAGLIMICSQLYVILDYPAQYLRSNLVPRFFIGRICMIGLRYRIVAGVTLILMLSEICLVIYVVLALGGHDARKLERPLGAALLAASVVDTLLTSALIIALRQTRAGLKQNGGIVDLIVTYGINTGH